MKNWMVLGLAALSLGCGDPEDEESSRDSNVVADFKRELGVDFARCPEMRSSWVSCRDQGCGCSTAELDAAQCLIDALATCKPAHLTVRSDLGTEGWILTDYLVVPDGQGCNVVQFYDTTNIVDHCHDVTRQTCGSLKLEDRPSGCSLWVSGSCSDPVEVVVDPGPFCSMDG